MTADRSAVPPATKPTTELLFLLDKLTQASLDALTTLLDTDAQQDLWWTRNTNRAAYRLVIGLRRYYADRLRDDAGVTHPPQRH